MTELKMKLSVRDQRPVEEEIKKSRWRWIGQRKPKSCKGDNAQNLQGEKERRRPRETWQRSVKTTAERQEEAWDRMERAEQEGTG